MLDPIVATLIHHDQLSRKDLARENGRYAASESFGPVTGGDGNGDLGRNGSRHG
jgi:hypothetical protein